MKEELQKFHNSVLDKHKKNFYAGVMDKEHVTGFRKMMTFRTKELNSSGEQDKLPPMEGFIGIKDNQKYFFTPDIIDLLPVRIIEPVNEVVDKDQNLVYIPNEIKSFRIKPEAVFETSETSKYEWFEGFFDVSHSEPLQFKAWKMISFANEIGSLCTAVSAGRGFCKTQLGKIMGYITNKTTLTPVGTYKGMLDKVSGTGCLYVDEFKKMDKNKTEAIQDIILQIGGSSDNVQNEALKTSQTRKEYDISEQSLCLTFNLIEEFENPAEFFDNLLRGNKEAMLDRLLQFRFTGRITEHFDKEFNLEQVAEDNKMFYINCAKYLCYLQKKIRSAEYKRRFKYQWSSVLTNRTAPQISDIAWVCDYFSRTQEEFEEVMGCIEKANRDYKVALTQ